jgi:hypothetical protein
MPKQPFRNIKFLQKLIDEYRMKALYVVFKLRYAGKYVIVSGKSLGGSLYFIQLGYSWYTDGKEKEDMLYLHLYRHVKAHPRGQARVDVLFETSDQYQLLKMAQEAIDNSRYSDKCLNNNTEPYIPAFNEATEKYGWMDKGPVLNFKKLIKSKKRTYRSRSSSKSRLPAPAKSGPKGRTGSSSPA